MGAHRILLLCALILIFSGNGWTSPAGTEFITTFIQNGVTSGSNPRCELRVSGLQDQTLVNVVVRGGVYNASFTVDSGKTITVRLPTSAEIRGNSKFTNTVHIKASKNIVALIFNGKASSGETSVVYPISSLGTKYYLFTPKTGSSGSTKVFAMVAAGEETSVEIHNKGLLQYDGKRYPANSVFTITIPPWNAVQMISSDDLSGSQVVADKPMTLICGHTCAQKNTKCNNVFEQFKPVSAWGDSYIVAPFSFQQNSDIVAVIAAEPTEVTIISGDTQNKQSMVAGQVLEQEISKTPLRIEADKGIQVTYLNLGGRGTRSEYGPFMMDVIDTDSYCSAYVVFGQQGPENMVIIVAENTALNEMTFDAKPLKSPVWNPIAKTDYSWLEYTYGSSMTSHRVELPTGRFGLQSLGISSPFSYGNPGTCVKDPGPPPPSCKNTRCPSRRVCVMENKKPKCVKPQVDLCWAFGDPHYFTFDQLFYDFMGTCTYTFATVCGDVDPDLPKFTILMTNNNRGNVHVSYVGQVTLTTGKHAIVVKREEPGYVRVDNCLRKLPIRLINGTLRMFQSGNAAIIQLGNDMMMSYDWNHVLLIELTRRYAGKMCGMCGNYNQKSEDDFLMPSGSIAETVVGFGASWAVQDTKFCWHDCRGPCLSCPPNVATQYTTNGFCGLIGKTDGPFSACHSVLAPKIYMDSCVFDVCINNGYKKLSCQAVGAYAEICQRAGVNIGPWRDAAGCPLPCPTNSSYKSCGRACPATCEDPEGKSECDQPCVECCECNAGFVLSEGKCIPRSSCGCSHNGYSYAPNEEFWNDDLCRQKCKCNSESHKVECRDSPCRAGEECFVKDGILDCYPKTYATCDASCSFITFDKKRVDFQGTCVYLMAGLSDHSRGLSDFQVHVRKQSRGNFNVSYTSTVYITVDNMAVQVSRQYPNKVLVNNQLLNLPYKSSDGKFSFYRSPSVVVLSFSFGLTVKFDYKSLARITIPETYANAVNGICGNFNKNPNDDLIPKGGKAVADLETFGKSWKKEEAFRCRDDGSPVCNDLESEEKRQRDGITECGVLVSKQGPFRECHSVVEPQPYFSSCVYEYCVLQKSQRTFCSVMTSYMMVCQEAGVTIQPWRRQDFCPFSCPAHSSYELCMDSCPVTCNDLSVPSGCTGGCTEGCACHDGFILSGGECIPINECGCSYNGAYYSVGQSIYVGDSCSQTCSCTLGGIMKCVSSSCGPNEKCRVEDGVLGCHPLGSATCTTSGYSNYQSFDGKAYKFQGQCSYVLAQTCGDGAPGRSKKLDEFKVTIKHEKRDGGSGVVESVSVEVGGHTLTLRRRQRGIVQINGTNSRLPATLQEGKIRAECYGKGTLIKTSFGLIVRFDHISYVAVTVPGSYRSAMCGLCGNYNGKADDDGVASSNVIEFGNKWKAPGDAGKECGDCGSPAKPCTTCMAQKQQVFSGNNYCGIIKDPSGPFAICHSVVKETSYYDNCVSDLCETNGEDSSVLCNSAYVYADACRQAGVKDLTWRTDSFCPMACDPHSHYRSYADMCSTTCASFSDMYECPESRDEGCECDEGYVFDGAKCLPLDQCGCFADGLYYQANEVMLNDDCSRECTCNPLSGVTCRNKTCAEGEKCQILDGVRSCVSSDPCLSKTCRAKESCQLEDGLPVCVPDYSGLCWVWGDPHCHTFDSKHVFPQGTCSYIMAQYSGNDTGLLPFRIITKNNNRGSQAFSFVKRVEIHVYEYVIVIEVGRFPRVLVNDQLTNLPCTLADGKVKMYRSGFDAFIEVEGAFKTSFDWNSYFTVTLPSSYYNEVSGLCGNFNQDPDDDLRTQKGELVSSLTDWIKEWKVYDRDPFCFDECPSQQCPTCDEAKKVEYESDEKCGVLFKQDGPFRDCIKEVYPDQFYDACLFDVCMNGGAQAILCQSLEVFASVCLKEGLKLYDWRTPMGCPKICPDPNSHYNACGNACPACCSDRNAPSRCTQPCVETCECNKGMLLSGGKCVPVSECGCQYNGRYYDADQSWYDEKCTQHCKCEPALGMVVCQETSCKKSETCMVADGIRGCYPTRYSTCVVSSDLRYTTLDKKQFRFTGTCAYQMVGVTSNDPSLHKFKISVSNGHRGNRAMAFINEVTLEAYNKTFTLNKDQRMKVDGQITNLPYNLDTNKIMVSMKGLQMVLSTDFGVSIIFDTSCNLRVTVPSSYTGAVNGLCGNDNGDATDDFTFETGVVAKNEKEFGEHWRVVEAPGCTSECTNCPTCTEAEKGGYKSDQYCGLLTKADGPFSQCHASIAPAPFFEDCVSSACAYKGHRSVVCSAIASYVSQCQRNGSVVKEWRTPSFCYLTCPPKSHYNLLGDGCPATCFGLMPPLSCAPTYTEGCYCDDGYILSGDDCVPIAECGCVYQNAYYKLGQEFYASDGCQKRCTCGANDNTTCESSSCGANEECGIVDGVLGCQPKEYAQCVALPGAGYISADGRHYELRGTCTYTLVKAKRGRVSFEVKVRKDNEARTRSVNVRIGNDVIDLQKGGAWAAVINKEKYNLPYVAHSKEYWINKEGNNVVVESDYGVKVLYDLGELVLVKIPSTLAGDVEGLGGNFNKNPNDDFRLPNGTLVTDLNEFAKSWATGSDCHGCSGDQCPKCDQAQVSEAQSPSKCGLMADPKGPFKGCHVLLPPETYLKSCVSNLCLEPKRQEALCASLQAYTALCQEKGGKIEDWRRAASCPLTCSANSHYELCTRTCDVTCNGLSARSTCSGNCSEGCECDSGYMFDGEKCVTMQNCGCSYNGRYFTSGETFLSEDCGQECTCSPTLGVRCQKKSCAENETCQVWDGVRSCRQKDPCAYKTCRKNESCKSEDDKAVCVPDYTGECWVWGDPHYRSLDNKTFDAHGTCTYILSQYVGSDPSLEPFKILIKKENRGTEAGSYVRKVELSIYKHNISVSVGEYNKIRVNGERTNLPVLLADGKLRGYQSGLTARLEADNGLLLTFDWNWDCTLTLPSSYHGVVGGLCGNFNLDPNDDHQAPDGTLMSSIPDWEAKWKVPDGDIFCSDQCKGPTCPTCDDAKKRQYIGSDNCGVISSPDGPFRDCLKTLSPAPFFDACLFDVCVNGGAKAILCKAVEAYAKACLQQGVKVQDWRTPSGCPMACNTMNSHYNACGNACPATCSDRDAPTRCSKLTCVETCECNEGMVLSGDKCVPLSGCGCEHKGRYYEANQSWYDETCSTLCKSEAGKAVCQPSKCKSSETCKVVNGVRGCHPTGYSVCIADGDPRYMSFDKMRFSYMGTCVYQLVNVTSKDPTLTPFSITVQNDQRGNKAISFTKGVKIHVHSKIIALNRDHPKRIEVDGGLTNLPYYHEPTQMAAYLSGRHIRFETIFGLSVIYDGQNYLRVTIPNTYAGAVSGLCGNNNGNPTDDFIKRDGTTAKTAKEFGDHWKVGEPAGCREECADCPTCSDKEKEIYRSGKHCGLLIQADGPFGQCHASVDPKPFFQNCIDDACEYKGHRAVVCSSISSYVYECQRNGSKIKEWRSPSFCDLPCPPNSRYKLLGDGCPVTCSGLIPPPACQPSYTEGCYCNDGFILSGEDCVPVADCGCVYENAYYKPGQEFYTDNRCQKKCTAGKNGVTKCASSSCGANEECKAEGGTLGCHPKEFGQCIALGDPHVITPDGTKYDFQGTCTYVLIRMKRGPVDFEVIVDHEAYGSGGMTITRSVTVKSGPYVIQLGRDGTWTAVINKEKYNLPCKSRGREFWINKEGNNIIVRTKDQFVVLFNQQYLVSVWIPSTFFGLTQGLCGNSNKNPNDDLRLPNGTLVNDVTLFGASWVVGRDGSDCRGCSGDQCPKCDKAGSDLANSPSKCGMIADRQGPFKDCHKLVEPDTYVKSCVSDVCNGRGGQEAFCANLQSYTALCQAKGAKVGEWRNLSNCPLACPANSHPSVCTRSCDFTCYGLLTSSTCSGHCYEGCECDSGYVFDGERCVTIDQCGCLYDGRYLKANESLVNDNCTQECTCDPYKGVICHNKTCTKDEKCQLLDGVRSCVSTNPCNFKKCREKETCKVQDGKADCSPNYVGQCWAFGDPHFEDFDGNKFDHQGTCTYIFSKYNGSDPSLEPFEVTIKSNNRGNQATSFVKKMTVTIYDHEISWEVGEFPKIRVNGILTNLPTCLLGGKLNVSRSGLFAVLEAKNGMMAKYDWNWHGVLQLPSSYHGTLIGICGNFNGNPKDDLRAPNGTLLRSVSDLTVYDRDPFCFHSCLSQCPACDEKKKEQHAGDNSCGMIFKKDGPFRECIPKLDPRHFFDACLHDVCLNDGAKSILCPSLEAYASTCLSQGLKVHDWRTPSGCPMVCEDKNSHYNACANACPASCFNRNARATCSRPCVETCECNTGMVLSGDKCVPVSSCGCQYDGQYYTPNQSWYDDKCSVLCKCDSMLGLVDCRPTSCKDNEDCTVSNGKRGCHPTGYSTCGSSGGPHYESFDEKRYRFMGSCIYQMVKVTSNDSSLTPFTINVLNDQRANKVVTNEVNLEIYNKTVTMSKDYPQQIKVDGVIVDLPYNFESNKIIAFFSGRDVILKAENDLTLTYGGWNLFRIILPSTYKGAVSGMCGNNNRDPSDDFLIGDGRVAKTAEEFCEHWKVGEVKGCSSSCPDCAKCTEKDREAYKTDKHCGLLTKSDGPFSQCHGAIAPAPYLDNCAFDACAYKGLQSVVCDSIAAYVSDCQRNGSVIKEWRTPSFCDKSCPSNSHYELLGDGCPATCVGLIAPLACNQSYTEGCYCDNGFILSGKDCVSIPECGCVYENTYYKAGQEFYTNNLCQKKCSCGQNGVVSCQSAPCRADEECKTANGVLGCHPKEFGHCKAYGDSHFITLDGKYFNYHGSCSYTLIKVQNGKVHFEVTITNKPYGGVTAKRVTVRIGDNIIYFDGKKTSTIVLNKEKCNLPYRSQSRDFWINKEGKNEIINTKYDISLITDMDLLVLVTLPSQYAGLTKGLCGNYNKNPDDDFLLPNNSIVAAAAVFGESWAVARDGSNCKGCSGSQCPKCSDASSTQAKSPTMCGIIGDPQGPFKECHGLVSPKQYQESCVLDVCPVSGGQAALCASLQAYTALCQQKGAKVGAWRNISKCPFACPANSHYELCTRTCDFSCSGLRAPSTCGEQCFEGCQCDTGYMFDGDKSVTMDQCGAVHNGRYLKTNEVLVSEDCSQRCTCKSGVVSCVRMSCAANETCQLRDGVRSCQPKDSQCVLGADLHFTTFDGASGNFPALGSYILASSCNASQDGHFMVVIDVHNCGTGRSLALQVFTSQGLVSVNQDGQIWLNGWEIKTPAVLGGGALSVKKSATVITIELRDRISIIYEVNRSVKLIAKEKMSRNVCGSCGNFNRDAGDDLLLRDGHPSVDVTFTIKSWAAKHLSKCIP